MTEHAQPDPNEPPEDVASLYSWANLHGGKYRDFSASRAEIREKARQRMEEAIEEERLRAQREAKRSPLPKLLAPRMNHSGANLPRSRPRNWLRRKLRRNVPARPRSWPRSAPHNRHKLLREPGNKRHGNSRRRIVTPRRLLTFNLHHRLRPLLRRKAHLLRSARPGFQPMQPKTPVAPPGSCRSVPNPSASLRFHLRLKTRCRVRAIASPRAGLPCAASLKAMYPRRRRQRPRSHALPFWRSFRWPAAWAKPVWWPLSAARFLRAVSAFCWSIPRPTACCLSSSARAISAPACCAPSVLRLPAATRPSR